MSTVVQAGEAARMLAEVIGDLSSAEALAATAVGAGAITKLIRVGQFFRTMWQGGVNQILADAERKRMLEEMVVEIHSKVYGLTGDVDVEAKPTVEDVALFLVELGYESQRASNHKKRWVLFQAFFGRFDPELYRDGLDKILWNIAKQLEYPEARFLREIVDEHGGTVVVFGKLEYGYLRNLDTLGLIATTQGNVGRKDLDVFATGLAKAFRRFIWDHGPARKPEDVGG